MKDQSSKGRLSLIKLNYLCMCCYLAVEFCPHNLNKNRFSGQSPNTHCCYMCMWQPLEKITEIHITISKHINNEQITQCYLIIYSEHLIDLYFQNVASFYLNLTCIQILMEMLIYQSNSALKYHIITT